jgi:hypothetical protein
VARFWWLTLIIAATWEAEGERIMVQGQPGQKVLKTLSQPIAGCNCVHLSCQLHGRLRLGGLWFQSQLQEKFTRLHLNRKSWTWRHMPVILATVAIINRRRVVQASLGKK